MQISSRSLGLLVIVYISKKLRVGLYALCVIIKISAKFASDLIESELHSVIRSRMITWTESLRFRSDFVKSLSYPG